MGKVTSTELRGVLSLCIAKAASGTEARRGRKPRLIASFGSLAMAEVPKDSVIPVNLVVG